MKEKEQPVKFPLVYFTERKKVFAINRKEADKGKTVCVQETLFCIEGVADQNESEKQQSG